jgi:uncharacterized membrane protein YfcA
MDWSFTQLLQLACLLFVAGIFSGIAAGLLGVGGGIIIVPVLFHLFTDLGIDQEVRMHVAAGTSLATVIATSIASMRAHHRRGTIDSSLLRAWGPAIFAGVLLGASVATFVRGPVLIAVFASIALIVALYMAFWDPARVVAQTLPRGWRQQAAAGTIGMISSMMGIGGGTLGVPVLTLFGFPIHRAVGSASALGLIIAVPGSIAFILNGWGAAGLPPCSLGYVNLLALAMILPTSMYFAPIGARAAHTLKARSLRQVFGLFLAITAVRMYYSIFF